MGHEEPHDAQAEDVELHLSFRSIPILVAPDRPVGFEFLIVDERQITNEFIKNGSILRKLGSHLEYSP